ncbi:MAG: glucose-6-phosphate isomerase, partial [Gammaproteobacteria bacterium]
MSALTDSVEWQALLRHFEAIKDVHMRDLFANDPQRFEQFSLKFNNILFDYSKNRITETTLPLLIQLAEKSDLSSWIERMFSGEAINHTEQRPVLHVALRNYSNQAMYANGVDVMPEVCAELDRVKALAEAVRTRAWRGVSNQPITDVVNIGIGGSHLGPLMATEALVPYALHDLRIHYVSNIDENHINDTLEHLSQETTLFIISSKTFTTQDTMVNADTAKNWFLRHVGDETSIQKHFV